MLASLLGLAGRDEAGVLPYAGGNAEPISSPEIVDYRNRQFDPATGRFLQRDPVLGGDELFNPYCFPSNNPVTNADSYGDRVKGVYQYERKLEQWLRDHEGRSPAGFGGFRGITGRDYNANGVGLAENTDFTVLRVRLAGEDRFYKVPDAVILAEWQDRDAMGKPIVAPVTAAPSGPQGFALSENTVFVIPKNWSEWKGKIGESVDMSQSCGVLPDPATPARLTAQEWNSMMEGGSPGKVFGSAGLVVLFGTWTVLECIDFIPTPDDAPQAVARNELKQGLRETAQQGAKHADEVMAAGETAARTINRLPGGKGIQVSRRLTPEEMLALTSEHGVEFSLVYRTGPGKAGGGGTYFLYSGTKNSVQVPIETNVRWIYHTHPGGTRYASGADKAILERLEELGSPQRSSQVVPMGQEVKRFKAD
jgi:RHS repeat-associated protein